MNQFDSCTLFFKCIFKNTLRGIQSGFTSNTQSILITNSSTSKSVANHSVILELESKFNLISSFNNQWFTMFAFFP